MLILITGKQGAGKGHVARECTQAGVASHVDVDHILIASAIPKHGNSSLTNWDRWRSASQIQREECITRGFKASYGRVKQHPPHLIVEGAILCNEWFTAPLLSVLRSFVDDDFEICRYYLNASNADILRNVRVRAATDPKHRGHELAQFPDEQAIAEYHSGFDRIMREEHQKWEHFECAQELIVVIKSKLQSP